MKIRRRHVPSVLYNVRNAKRFKLRKQIYFRGQNYRRIEKIAPCYYIGWNGEVAKYDANADTMKRVDVRKDLRVRLFRGSGRGPVDVRLDYLVASAWKENRGGYRRVIHKNGNTMDCRAVNLMWVGSLGEVRSNMRGWVIEECREDGTRVCYPSVKDAVEGTLRYTPVMDLLEHLVTGEPFADGSVFRFKVAKEKGSGL